jgi:hypothetical protein
VVGDLRQRLETIGGGDDVAALLLQQRFRRAANGLRVVDDHDPQPAEISLFHLSPRIRGLLARLRNGASHPTYIPA